MSRTRVTQTAATTQGPFFLSRSLPMAHLLSLSSPFVFSSSVYHPHPSMSVVKSPNLDCFPYTRALSASTRGGRAVTMAVSSAKDGFAAENSTAKLVTFLGKGGSGKTTAAVFSAQHYAACGLRTCLVTHSEDCVVEHLLNCKIGTTPVLCGTNLSAVRLETTKMLLEPLNRIKQADARIKMSQGVLEGIVAEELGVLPGMDSIFVLLALMRMIGFLGDMGQRNQQKEKFDVTVYDGVSSSETLRMVGAANSARLYLKYLRSMAEKTDFGRLASPSLLRLVDDAIGVNGASGSSFNGKLSSEIWDSLERLLTRGSSIFNDPQRFGCYLVMDVSSPTSVNTASRLWGHAIQAGALVSGAFAISLPSVSGKSMELETIKDTFAPMQLALMPDLLADSPPDWKNVMVDCLSDNAKDLLRTSGSKQRGLDPAVKFDRVLKSVTLFMPGFDKSEIKLYQYRGGSELLVEAGDQRRVIQLPREVQGKVAGAKFLDRSLIITTR